MSNKGYQKVAGDEEDDENVSHPLSKANFFSAFTFWWMNDVLKTGSQRLLTQSDVFPIHEKYKTQELTEKLQKQWNKDVEECRRRGKQAKLWKSVLRTISLKEFCINWFASLLYAAGRVLQPLLLGTLIHLLMASDKGNGLAYGVAALMPLCGLTAATSHFITFQYEIIGLQLSSAIKGIVYMKVSRQLINTSPSQNNSLAISIFEDWLIQISAPPPPPPPPPLYATSPKGLQFLYPSVTFKSEMLLASDKI